MPTLGAQKIAANRNYIFDQDFDRPCKNSTFSTLINISPGFQGHILEKISNWHFHKGQLISKCLLGIFNSTKKRTKKFDFTTMVPEVELFSFVFWES